MQAVGERKRVETELRQTKIKGHLRVRQAATQEARALSAAASSDSQLQRLAAERDELSRNLQQLRHQAAMQDKQLKKLEEENHSMRQRLKARLTQSEKRGVTLAVATQQLGSAAPEQQPVSAMEACLRNQLDAQQRTHASLLTVFNDVYGILLAAATDYAELRQAACREAAAAIVRASDAQSVLVSDVERVLSSGSADLLDAVGVMQQRAKALTAATAAEVPQAQAAAASDEMSTVRSTTWMQQWPTEQQIDQAIPQLQAKLDEVQAAVDSLGGEGGGEGDAASNLLDAVHSVAHAAKLKYANSQLHSMLQSAAGTLGQQQRLLIRAAAAQLPSAGSPEQARHLTPTQLLGMSPAEPVGQRERFLRRRLAALEERETAVAQREAAVEEGEIALLCASPACSAAPVVVSAPPLPAASAAPDSMSSPEHAAARSPAQQPGNRTPLGEMGGNRQHVSRNVARAKGVRQRLKPWQGAPHHAGGGAAAQPPRKAGTAFTVSF